MMKSEGGGGVVDGGGGEKDGQFFVDQTTGQYYFQSNDGETMTMVDENDTEATAGPSGTYKLSKLSIRGVPLPMTLPRWRGRGVRIVKRLIICFQ